MAQPNWPNPIDSESDWSMVYIEARDFADQNPDRDDLLLLATSVYNSLGRVDILPLNASNASMKYLGKLGPEDQNLTW